MAFTLESKLGDLLDDQEAKLILDKHMPGASTNPMIGMARGLSLSAILAMPQATQFGITKEKVEGILAEINSVA